jgi:hypothetical protein
MLVSIQRGPEIETVARTLVGQRRQYRDFLPGCDTQIKIELDDVDATLDEINTLITVQSALQDATNGLMYTSWNQNFGAPRHPTRAPVQTQRSRARRVSSTKTSPHTEKSKPKKPGEQEWQTCRKPGYMLGTLLDGRVTDRKARLFACACCRMIWHHIDAQGRAAVELAEAFADGQVSDKQRAKAFAEMKAGPVSRDNHWQDTARQALEKRASKYESLVGQSTDWGLASDLAPKGTEIGVFNDPYLEQAGALRANLVRELFTIPFSEIAIKKHWLTAAVLEEAKVIYEERAFNRMPMLAAALAKAGCTVQEIIGHCRSKGPHFRGCWVIDMILGKK